MYAVLLWNIVLYGGYFAKCHIKLGLTLYVLVSAVWLVL
jgi:hypothetical protein